MFVLLTQILFYFTAVDLDHFKLTTTKVELLNSPAVYTGVTAIATAVVVFQ